MTDHKKRNATIKRLVSRGMAMTEVARRYKLSSTRIAQICGTRPPTGSSKQRVVAALPSPESNGKLQAQKADFEAQIAYVYGRIESQLEVYASNLGIPFLELTLGVSKLLSDKARGKVVGTPHRVSSVR